MIKQIDELVECKIFGQRVKINGWIKKWELEELNTQLQKGIKYTNLMNANSQVVKENISLTELQIKLNQYKQLLGEDFRNTEHVEDIKKIILDDKKSLKLYKSRYENLRDRYLYQNKKHFDELCGLYFDDERVGK
jgi:hypothetical protein